MVSPRELFRPGRRARPECGEKFSSRVGVEPYKPGSKEHCAPSDTAGLRVRPAEQIAPLLSTRTTHDQTNTHNLTVRFGSLHGARDKIRSTTAHDQASPQLV